MDNELLTASDKHRVLRFAAKASACLVCFLLLLTLGVVFWP